MNISTIKSLLNMLKCLDHGVFRSHFWRNTRQITTQRQRYNLFSTSNSSNFCTQKLSGNQTVSTCHNQTYFKPSLPPNQRTFSYWTISNTKRTTLDIKHNFTRNWFGFHKNHWQAVFRNLSNFQKSYKQRNRTTALYIIALVTVVLGGSYAAVPLYRIFCQASGLGGTVQQTGAGEKIKNMPTKKERLIAVRFNADKSATMQWSFRPQQTEVKVYPGETALAFYTAKNPTNVAITGISTYNVIPFEAGQYFNKIQCFCFEEQRLNPHEQVDMPVFFYIDPEFCEDPALYKVDTITLSYTFFQAKEAHHLDIQ